MLSPTRPIHGRIRSPRLAPGAGYVDARRGDSRGARALGITSAGARRFGRRGRLPRAGVGIDGRPRASRFVAPSPLLKRSNRRVFDDALRLASNAEAGPLDVSQQAEVDLCGLGSRSRRIAGTRLRHSCSPPPQPSSRWTLDEPKDLSGRAFGCRVRRSLGGLVWCTRGRGRGTGSARARDAARRGGSAAGGIGSDEHGRSGDSERRPCERRCVPSEAETSQWMTVSAGGGGWRAGPPASSGTTSPGTRSRCARFEPRVRPAHLLNFHSPSALVSACACSAATSRRPPRSTTNRRRSPRRPTVASCRRTECLRSQRSVVVRTSSADPSRLDRGLPPARRGDGTHGVAVGDRSVQQRPRAIRGCVCGG